FIVFVEASERRIPMQYARRVVGRYVMGGGATDMPLRVNSGGVMPVIFASSILTFPQMASTFLAKYPSTEKFFKPVLETIRWGEPLYTLLYVVGIVFFAYFYVSIVFAPRQVAQDMQKHGAFVPGIRPGTRTENH